MGTELRDYALPLAALLVGGVAPSIGFTLWARTDRGRALLARIPGWAVALVSLVALGGGGGALWWTTRRALEAAGNGSAFPGPVALLGLGLAIGLPLALPAVLIARSEARAANRGRRPRDHVPTKDDRRAFARDLESQIREVSTPPREVQARIGGDGGRVLVLEGDLDAAEGERLTQALRADLKELGFRRVQGAGAREWWTRV